MRFFEALLLSVLLAANSGYAQIADTSPELSEQKHETPDLVRASLKHSEKSGSAARSLDPSQQRLDADTLNKILNFAAEYFKTDRSSPMIQELGNILNGKQSDVEMPVPPRYSEEKDTRPIVAHYRAKSGIPFPDKKQLEVPMPQRHDEYVKARIKTMMSHYMTKLKEQITTQPDLPALPACKEDSTKRYSTGYKGKDDGKFRFLDMLFIADRMPEDTSEIFGRQTLVVQYIKEKGPVAARFARDYGVTCLPFRVRATKKFVMRDRGVNALKNYDKDPHGKGVLHDFMKKKLGLTKEAKREEKARRAK